MNLEADVMILEDQRTDIASNCHTLDQRLKALDIYLDGTHLLFDLERHAKNKNFSHSRVEAVLNALQAQELSLGRSAYQHQTDSEIRNLLDRIDVNLTAMLNQAFSDAPSTMATASPSTAAKSTIGVGSRLIYPTSKETLFIGMRSGSFFQTC